MIEKLPPGMEEAISNGDLLRCSNCKSWLIVRIEVAKQSFDWMDEAAEQSVEPTAPHVDVPIEDVNSAHYRFVRK